jgi:outer membrane receptor protein involved in Fe transport
LIDLVTLSTTPTRTTQYQNVGRVKNLGVEVEGALTVGSVELQGQYGYSRSRVDQLAPNYTGDLQLGDQVRNIPRHTAGASATIDLFRGTTVATGLSYVGSWNEYNYLAYYQCLGGTGSCHNTTLALKDYLIAYPGFVKLNATISQQLTRSVSSFIRVENVTNSSAFEVNSSVEVMGRITTIGLRVGT